MTDHYKGMSRANQKRAVYQLATIVRKGAQSGFTASEVAKMVGRATFSVYRIAAAHGISFRGSRKPAMQVSGYVTVRCRKTAGKMYPIVGIQAPYLRKAGIVTGEVVTVTASEGRIVIEKGNE